MATVWITGADRGIGAAIAHRFADTGNRIVLHYHKNEQQAQQTQAQLEAKGASVLLCQGDVKKDEDIERIHRQIVQTCGEVDVFVHNAGMAQQKLFPDISRMEWNDMMDVHVTGAYLCIQRVLPSMISKKKGKIVLISSIWGLVGASCEVHYSTAKAALLGLTKALAKEVAPCHIQVNCVAPGLIQTDMMASFSEEDIGAMCDDIPAGSLGTAKQVASAVHFLCSKEADYITGQVISPNGGYIT